MVSETWYASFVVQGAKIVFNYVYSNICVWVCTFVCGHLVSPNLRFRSGRSGLLDNNQDFLVQISNFVMVYIMPFFFVYEGKEWYTLNLVVMWLSR